MNALPDFAQDLLANHGNRVLTWILALLAAAGGRLLLMITSNKKAQDAARTLALHARDAVQATFQTYVEAIKKARADGKLTDAEAAEARAKAVAILRDRLGWKALTSLGGGLLSKLFLGDKWADKVEKALGTAVEVAVADEKKLGKAAGLTTSGTKAPASPPQ